VNIFAAAWFLAQPLGRAAPVFFGIAAIVAYSRVYIGIHYPFDVVGGAAIGLLIAWPMRRLKDKVVARFHLRLPRKRWRKGKASSAVPGFGINFRHWSKLSDFRKFNPVHLR
jgi:membrane-associated phospholipid phosphatase